MVGAALVVGAWVGAMVVVCLVCWDCGGARVLGSVPWSVRWWWCAWCGGIVVVVVVWEGAELVRWCGGRCGLGGRCLGRCDGRCGLGGRCLGRCDGGGVLGVVVLWWWWCRRGRSECGGVVVP